MKSVRTSSAVAWWPRPDGAFLTEILLALLLGTALLFAGGSWGLGDALLAAASVLLVMRAAYLHFAVEPGHRLTRGQLGLLGGFLAFSALQLVPLPSPIWSSLAGRDSVARDLALVGLDGIWRPIGLDSAGALRGVLAMLPGAAVAMCISHVTRSGLIRLAGWLVAFGCLSALLGLVQVAGGQDSRLRFHDFHNWQGALGFFANRNHLAAFLVMCLPVAIALLAIVNRHGTPMRDLVSRQLPLAAAIVLMIVGCLMTTSRAGILLGLAVLVASAFLWPVSGHGNMLSRRGATAVLAAAATLLGAGTVAAGIARRFGQILLEDSRWRIMSETWELRSQYGWWGSGLGSFEQVFSASPANQVVVGAYVNHAHNDWLELWLELGWLFPALGMVAVIAFAVAARKIWRVPAIEPVVLLARGASISIVAVALHSLVDWPLRTGSNMVVVALLASILWRGAAIAGPSKGAHAERARTKGSFRRTSRHVRERK